MVRRVATILAAFALAAACAGCDSVLTGLVGDPHGPQGVAKSTLPAPPSIAYATNSLDSQSHLGGTQAIMPPTIPLSSFADSAEDTEPVGPVGPRPPIAVAPLTEDSTKLAELGAAAARVGTKGDTRFVLLVLAPAPADATAIGASNAQSRAAATAALHAIVAAGIDARRVEISGATSATAGTGEIRLYVR
jgi:hypothetical protein